MILDTYKLQTLIVQIEYFEAFALWDRAGVIAQRAASIWPGLKLANAEPRQQTLRSNEVQIQTTMDRATVTLKRPGTLDARKVKQLEDIFEVWRRELNLTDVKRVSTRALYAKEYSSLQGANASLLKMNLVKWPSTKVFDQPLDSDLNGVDVQYRFEDSKSFAVLRLKAERVKYEVELDPEFVEDHEIDSSQCRLVIDFDRGLIGTVGIEKFRMDEWLKGFQHILRRDLNKIIGDQA